MTIRELFERYPRLVQFQVEPFRAIAWFVTTDEIPADPADWVTDALEVPQLPDAAMRVDATAAAMAVIRDPAEVKPQVWHRGVLEAAWRSS